MNFVVNTGTVQRDHEEIARYQQHYRAQGLEVYAQPLPGGGFQITVAPAPQAAAAPQPAAPAPQYGAPQPQYGAPQPQYGAPQPQYGAPQPATPAPQQPQYGAPQPQYGAPQPQYGAPAPAAGYGAPAAPQQASAPYGGQQQYGSPPGYGAAPSSQAYGAASAQQYGASPQPLGGPAYAMAGGGSLGVAAAAEAVPALSTQRVAYLRKVYGLLAISAFLALFSGWAAITLGPTVPMTSSEGAVQVPFVVALMLGSPIVLYGAFGLLFVGTIAASAVSKVRVLNVVALFAVATLMGVELAPMAFVAQYAAGFGDTLSANPIRDTMVMVLSVFLGITGYIFVTRKDFSWMGSILSMGVMVIFGACLLTFVFKTEVFSLAVASAGALLSVGMLLYVTSYIFRNSEMDDAVGDALSLLVQLRNLFMFLLRILMSSRR
jgi:FtsH-binding integral membrane protein